MDISLSYSETGSGIPLILLHGNGEDRSYFQGQIGPFSARRRVITPDTRGHGQSPRGCAPFTLHQFAEDLLALMNRLGIESADLLGFSDGGNIALLFALRYPQRVRRLVLNGANLYPSGMKSIYTLAIDGLYLLASLAAPFSPKAARKRELLGLMATQPHIRPDALQGLTLPVLVIAGTRDLIRERHTRLIARSLPDAQLLFLKGTHTVAFRCPEAFNAAVLAFLEG